MSNMSFDSELKLFHISNQMLEDQLDSIENQLGISLGRAHVKSIEEDADYYPQIDASIRAEARSMSEAYEIFYSLEKTIRGFIEDSFEAAGIIDWWNHKECVPEKIKKDTENRIQRELDAGVTPRSDDPIDYTNFGELNDIIVSNWEVFAGTLQSKKAVTKVLSGLNTLRAPIAHCSMLAEDETIRLKLSVRDWFRLMG